MAPRYSLLYFLQNAKRRTRGINHSGKLPWGSISHHFNHRRGELYNSDQPLCIVVIHPVMSLEKDDIDCKKCLSYNQVKKVVTGDCGTRGDNMEIGPRWYMRVRAVDNVSNGNVTNGYNMEFARNEE
ncbi:hypothetical protein DEO72_LG3g2166 [Vigna unguiculata]|uniref:Uncharacterized protein n=1 Tax=Vigna unguiculata TaxID=3917 RepID=A0A4D6LGJ1_VIGUN|nr:hypothetical protein DEO72_LG3g2166 [Vigna unguiculata]